VFKRFTIISALFLPFFFSLSARDIDLNRLALDSAKQKKILLVWLHKTDCGYCEAMNEFTLNEDKIAALLKSSFSLVDINIHDDNIVAYKDFTGSGREFAKRVGYDFYPSSLFIDDKAEIIFAAPGYVEEKDFFKMLDYVKSGAYRTMNYDTYNRGIQH